MSHGHVGLIQLRRSGMLRCVNNATDTCRSYGAHADRGMTAFYQHVAPMELNCGAIRVKYQGYGFLNR